MIPANSFSMIEMLSTITELRWLAKRAECPRPDLGNGP